MKYVRFILIQLTSIIGITLIILYILDIYNPMMQFINNRFTKDIILAMGVLTLVSNQLFLWIMRPRPRKKRIVKEESV